MKRKNRTHYSYLVSYRRNILALFLNSIMLITIVSGCSIMNEMTAETQLVVVDSYSSGRTLNGGYELKSYDLNMAPLEKMELESRIRKALNSIGLVENSSSPGYIIYYTAGINSDTSMVTVKKPIFGNSGTTTTTSGTVNIDYNGNARVKSQSTTRGTGLEVVGVRRYNEQRVNNQKYIHLHAYPVDTNIDTPYCTVASYMEGKSTDLRRYTPYILSGAMRYFNKNSGAKKKISVYSSDKSYRAIISTK